VVPFCLSATLNMHARGGRSQTISISGHDGRAISAQVPVGLPDEGVLSQMTAAAHDGMRVPLVLLPELPRLMPAIAAALGDDEAALPDPMQ
jgi:hypothetical protein